MASLMYAKEATILSTLKDLEENHRRTQDVNLMGSNVWKAKSVAMTANLVDAMVPNTKLTSLNMSDCMLNDACLSKLSEMLAHNATLFHLHLANNKFSRPGLLELGKALGTNTGLISLDLSGHRINSEVCSAFLTAYDTNFTLCKVRGRRCGPTRPPPHPQTLSPCLRRTVSSQCVRARPSSHSSARAPLDSSCGRPTSPATTSASPSSPTATPRSTGTVRRSPRSSPPRSSDQLDSRPCLRPGPGLIPLTHRPCRATPRRMDHSARRQGVPLVPAARQARQPARARRARRARPRRGRVRPRGAPPPPPSSPPPPPTWPERTARPRLATTLAVSRRRRHRRRHRHTRMAERPARPHHHLATALAVSRVGVTAGGRAHPASACLRPAAPTRRAHRARCAASAANAPQVGDENGSMIWCSIAGRWELGRIEGKRGQGQRRKLVVTIEEVEHEIDPKDTTQFEPSHAQARRATPP